MSENITAFISCEDSIKIKNQEDIQEKYSDKFNIVDNIALSNVVFCIGKQNNQMKKDMEIAALLKIPVILLAHNLFPLNLELFEKVVDIDISTLEFYEL